MLSRHLGLVILIVQQKTCISYSLAVMQRSGATSSAKSRIAGKASKRTF